MRTALATLTAIAIGSGCFAPISHAAECDVDAATLNSAQMVACMTALSAELNSLQEENARLRSRLEDQAARLAEAERATEAASARSAELEERLSAISNSASSALTRADELASRVATLEARGWIPVEAVVAFDSSALSADTCPDGWTSFRRARARVIVGAGDPSEAPQKLAFDENGEPLDGYVHRQHGGEQAHRLTEAEMPAHQHPLRHGTSEGLGSNTGKSPTPRPYYFPNKNYSTQEHGGAWPHNNMPPYIALYFCKYEGTQG